MGQHAGPPPAPWRADPPSSPRGSSCPERARDPAGGAPAHEPLLDLLGGESGGRATRARIRDLLEAVSSAVDDADLGLALHRIVTSGCGLVDAERGALAIVARDRRAAELVTVGIDPETAAKIGGGRPTGRGVRRGDHRTPGLPLARALPPGHPDVTTFVAAPVSARGHTFGTLYLGDKRGGSAFTGEDEAITRALAAIAAFTIDNVVRHEETRRREAWLAASAEITTALLSADSRRDALALVARRARQVVGADLAAVVLPSAEEPGTLVVSVADGTGAEVLRGLPIVMEGSLYAETLLTGRAVFVPDADASRPGSQPAGTALFGAAAATLGIGPAMVLPLVAAGRCGGVLVVGAHRGRPAFCDLDLEMAGAFAGHAALALRMSGAQRERERLAVFEDRDRIARDLHDVVIQRVFATGLQLSAVARSVDGEAGEKLASAIAELDRTMDDIRRTIFSLKAAAADGPSLSEQIVDIATRATDWLGVEPDVRVEGPVDHGIPESIHGHLVAALRETLSNIARHAGATRIGVLVRAAPDRVLVEVRDNGRGPGGGSRTSGLANLRGRASDLGGQMDFGPGEDGTGTTVTWSVPIG